MPDRLLAHLRDVHSIEVQALAQMRAAPDLAGDEGLAAAFRHHLTETEGHERAVRDRLSALGSGPSTLKDAAGRAGGWGMVLFARSQPDTPGKLVAHAYSYEHMELAAYALLERTATAAGDVETAQAARRIGGEEDAMGQRLADGFDAAVAASLRDVAAADLDAHLDHYLADAHAIERQAVQLLREGARMDVGDALSRALEEHLAQTREHLAAVEARLDARGAAPSRVKDVALTVGGLNLGAFFGAQPDRAVKLAGFAYAFEHLEIAAYELLRRVAQRAGDQATAATATDILTQERAAARRVAATWDDVVDQAASVSATASSRSSSSASR